LEVSLGFNFGGPNYAFADSDGTVANSIMPPAAGAQPPANPLVWQVRAAAESGGIKVTCPQNGSYLRRVGAGDKIDFVLSLQYVTATRYSVSVAKKAVPGAVNKPLLVATSTAAVGDPGDAVALTVQFS
jgi:hypothetical protein